MKSISIAIETFVVTIHISLSRSLSVAFNLFRDDSYEKLRSLLFQQSDYMQFRKTVIDLVLCTDIASPERVQIDKSKWKEAFGDARSNKNNSNLSHSIHANMLDSFHRENLGILSKNRFFILKWFSPKLLQSTTTTNRSIL